METIEEKVARVLREDVAVVEYDPRWPGMFERERLHLMSCLPGDLIRRIEHFGLAMEYGDLKKKLSSVHQNDRVAYTQAKGDFIRRVTENAKQYYGKSKVRA